LHIIPVIDLLNGVVVHAKNGLRQHYQPIQSLLSASYQPLDVVKALLDCYPFTQLYIADLNAIQKLNSTYTTNLAVIQEIQQQYPQLELWLDAGISNHTELNMWHKIKAKMVLGSESFSDIANYLSLSVSITNPILSLDFFVDGYHGPAELLTQHEYWPQDIIVMTLGNVGANCGINNKLLTEVLLGAKGFNVYAAGGVRNIVDLKQLKSMNIKGALVATALHQRQISADDINAIILKE
jgi:phosphoribosylformimino-5-aminoimidazole carboxamide ribotide isomerase